MTREILIKRTIWEARCDCGAEPVVKEANAPKERLCPNCRKWIPYREISVTAPELGKR